jgi:hypothetical protein
LEAGVSGDRNDDAPSNQRDKREQDQKTSGDQQNCKANVDCGFDCQFDLSPMIHWSLVLSSWDYGKLAIHTPRPQLGESLVGTPFATFYGFTLAARRPERSLQRAQLMQRHGPIFGQLSASPYLPLNTRQLFTEGKVAGTSWAGNPGQAVSLGDRSGLFSVNRYKQSSQKEKEGR